MPHFLRALFFAAIMGTLAATTAFAHAFLDRAVPGVGTNVHVGPTELQLTFTQNIVAAFSGVRLTAASGQVITTEKPVLGPPNTLHVRLARPLEPGVYQVSWHVVSIDTHPTQGTYRFTVAP